MRRILTAASQKRELSAPSFCLCAKYLHWQRQQSIARRSEIPDNANQCGNQPDVPHGGDYLAVTIQW